MTMAYATLTGPITLPGSDIGVRARIIATPLTTDQLLTYTGDDRFTAGPVVGETNGVGALNGMKVPTNSDLPGLLWQITAERLDKGPGPAKWTIKHAVAITGTGTIKLRDLVEVDVLTVDSTLVASVSDLAAAADASKTAAAGSATTAAGWADAAASSAADADTSADLADTSADTATTAANTATTKATEASTSATTATTKASEAAASASHAEDMAGAAEAVAVSNDTIIAGRINDSASATAAALTASIAGAAIPRWAASKSYAAGYYVAAPDGSVISRNATGVSRSAFDATEQAAWTPVISKSGTLTQVAMQAAIDGAITSGHVDPLVNAAIEANPVIDDLVAAVGTKQLTRTNLAINPSFETGTTGWSALAGTISNPTGAHDGTKCMRVTSTAAAGFTANGPVFGTVTPGESIALSVYVRGTIGRGIYLRATWTGATADTLPGSVPLIASDTAWQRLTWVVTVPAGATDGRLDILVPTSATGGIAAAVGHYFEADSILIERAAAVGAYFDGDTTDTTTIDYNWSATAHASTSRQYLWTPPAPEVTDPALADAVVKPTTRGVLDNRYSRTLDQLSPETVLQQEFVRSKGGRIGTSGKAAVALRFDHWLNNFGAVTLPLLTARGIPAGLCLFSGMLSGTWLDGNSTNYTWADVETWCIESGIELWCHSRSHTWDPAWGETELLAEIVTSKADLKTAMPKVKIQGWMMPGLNNPYPGFDTTTLSTFYTSTAGRLLRATYPVAETDAIPGGFRQLPTGPLYGAGHATTDTLTLDAMKAIVDEAIAWGLGVEFMTHCNFGAVGFNTVADYTAFLDYLVTKRDAGLIDIVTPSGLYVADPTATTRAELIRGGDFNNGFDPVTNPGLWTTPGSGITLGSDAGTPYLDISTSASTIYQTFQRAGTSLGFDGETFKWEADFRRAASGTAATARILLNNPTTGTAWTQQIDTALPSGTGWTRLSGCFTIPVGAKYFRLYAGRATGAGGGVHMKRLRVYKV